MQVITEMNLFCSTALSTTIKQSAVCHSLIIKKIVSIVQLRWDKGRVTFQSIEWKSTSRHHTTVDYFLYQHSLLFFYSLHSYIKPMNNLYFVLDSKRNLVICIENCCNNLGPETIWLLLICSSHRNALYDEYVLFGISLLALKAVRTLMWCDTNGSILFMFTLS